MILFPSTFARRPKQAGFLVEEIPGDISAGFYQACGGRLEDSRERKPARRRTHDYELFFVEMVPKRYTFGTGTLPKCLDLAWLERTPKRGVLGQNLNASSHQ